MVLLPKSLGTCITPYLRASQALAGNSRQQFPFGREAIVGFVGLLALLLAIHIPCFAGNEEG